MGADAKGGGGLVSPEVKKWGLRLLLGFAAFYFLLPALLGVSCDLTWNHGKIGCAALKRIEERRAGAADSPGPGFTVNGELNRRMHGGQPPPQRRTMQVHGVDRSKPPCEGGELRRDEAAGAWVCRRYY